VKVRREAAVPAGALAERDTGRTRVALVVAGAGGRVVVVAAGLGGSGCAGVAAGPFRPGAGSGRAAARGEERASDGPVAVAVTLAMTDDTPNHATAVAVAVPSAQVVIAADGRTGWSVHRARCAPG
jgi:hypothetical protein